MDNYCRPSVATVGERDQAIMDLERLKIVLQRTKDLLHSCAMRRDQMYWIEARDSMQGCVDRLVDCAADTKWAIKHIKAALDEEPVR